MPERRMYKKPDITKVKLTPRETMLSGCKRSDGSGGSGEKCPTVTGRCKSESGS